MTTEATEKERPEKPVPEKAPEPEPVEETGVIYSDAPDAGPPGSANAPGTEATEATETPADKGTGKKTG